jgi:hypothetical protein
MSTIIETLFREAGKLTYDEASGMMRVPRMMGPGFFPGCTGLYKSEDDFDSKPVMVLGQDFGNESVYGFLDLRGEVDKSVTWRHLKTLLSDIHIKPEQCFFTNAYMGLRKTDREVAGPVTALLKKAKGFADQCQTFFLYQLQVIKPELVLVMGKEPAGFIAEVFPDALGAWKEIGNLKDFYQKPDQISYEVEFEGRKIQFLFAMHPSMSSSNRGIIWKGKDGRKEETGMLIRRLGEFYKRNGIQFS